MRLSNLITWIFMMALANILFACSTETPARMNAYLGSGAGKGASSGSQSITLPEGKIQAGLLVINDTSAPGSAPSLSPGMLNELTQGIQYQIMKAVPVTFVKILDSNGISPQGDSTQLVDRAQQEGLGYLIVAVLSSNESEVPTYLPINGIIQGGGGPATTPGYEAQNFALAELALLDGNTGQSLLQAHGRAYSTMYRLNVPTESNVYPVVVRSRTFNPIYPEGKNAHDTLRGVSANDAIEKGVLEFKLAWDNTFPT